MATRSQFQSEIFGKLSEFNNLMLPTSNDIVQCVLFLEKERKSGNVAHVSGKLSSAVDEVPTISTQRKKMSIKQNLDKFRGLMKPYKQRKVVLLTGYIYKNI